MHACHCPMNGSPTIESIQVGQVMSCHVMSYFGGFWCMLSSSQVSGARVPSPLCRILRLCVTSASGVFACPGFRLSMPTQEAKVTGDLTRLSKHPFGLDDTVNTW